jgi:phage terminase large subunit GpA-like protein
MYFWLRLSTSVPRPVATSAAAWATLTELLGETWPHPSGAFLGLAKLAIDTGYESPAVYAWARRMGAVQVAAIKGVDSFNRAAPVVGRYVDATGSRLRICRGAKL